MSDIKITVNDQPLQQRLKHLEESLGQRGLTQVLGDIGQRFVALTKANIAAGHDWEGRAFAPNTEVTLSKKRGAKPLIDTGSFVTTRLYHHVSGNEVEIGASGVQAAVLHFGARQGAFGRSKRNGPIPWGNIPARPYYPIDATGQLAPAGRTEALQLIEEYLDSITER